MNDKSLHLCMYIYSHNTRSIVIVIIIINSAPLRSYRDRFGSIRVIALTAGVEEPHAVEVGKFGEEDDGQSRQVDDKVRRIVLGVKAGQNEPAREEQKNFFLDGS